MFKLMFYFKLIFYFFVLIEFFNNSLTFINNCIGKKFGHLKNLIVEF